MPGEGLDGSLTPFPSLRSTLDSALTAHASRESRNLQGWKLPRYMAETPSPLCLLSLSTSLSLSGSSGDTALSTQSTQPCPSMS